MKKGFNDFDSFLNECQTYVWEWYIPEQKVRFGIPSLNSLWIDDRTKNIKLETMLERVHPDDIQKVLVRHTSPLYRSDKMFEVDLRLNVADELMPDGKTASGKYEWFGFRGKTVSRDKLGRPTYVRGVAINLDERYRAQKKLISQKDYLLQNARQKTDYCAGVMQEMGTFLRSLAESANTFIGKNDEQNQADRLVLMQDLSAQAERIIELTDKFRQFVGDHDPVEDQDIRPLSLWEHLAEQQQIYSLKGPQLKIYFSNLYDNRQIYINVKLFDVLLENLIAPQRMLHYGGCVTISYSISPDEKSVKLTILCSTDQLLTPLVQEASADMMGVSVCRLLVKRLCGTFMVKRLDKDQVQYSVTLPFDPRKNTPFDEDDEKEMLDETATEELTESLLINRSTLPHVLIGMTDDAELYQNQHLFEVSISNTTEKMLEEFRSLNPDIVFLDNNLPGNLSVTELISQMASIYSDTPIIVSADYADRTLHKQIQQLGARYLITNPLSLRKVNMMNKKYLK